MPGQPDLSNPDEQNPDQLNPDQNGGITVPASPMSPYYTDIYTRVRRHLQTTVDVVTDDDIDFWFIEVSGMLFNDLAPQYGYTDLVTTLDRNAFDAGVGLMIAAALRPITPKSLPLGEVSMFRHSDFSTQYEQVRPARRVNLPTIEEQLIAQAKSALRRVSLFKASWNDLYQPAIPAYRNRDHADYGALTQEILQQNLIANEFSGEDGFGGNTYGDYY